MAAREPVLGLAQLDPDHPRDPGDLLAGQGIAALAAPFGLERKSSLTECRQIITAKWGPDATGACWALIHERWHQFLFGFYPQDLYWRPVMSFFLLFAAITPVLFFGNRRTNLRVIGGAAILMIVALLLLTGAKGQVTPRRSSSR
jgi:general L-amino acid transport system permease protein